MSQLLPIDIVRQLSNSAWRLPCKGAEENAVTVTFMQSSQFVWEVQAGNLKTRLAQAVTGPEWRGNWSVRATPRKVIGLSSLPGSGGNFLGSFGTSRKTASSQLPGPYLVLNFTDLAKCYANVTIMGTHLHFGDWLNHVWQIFRDGNFRILSFAPDQMRLECPGGKEIQVWHRATEAHVPAHVEEGEEEA